MSIANIFKKSEKKELSNEEKEKLNRIFAIIATIVYAVVTLIIALHHENWRDENQAYMLCRDLSFTDLLKQLKYEGHPFLWFFIMYPFVRLGASCKIVNILSYIIMCIAVYIILREAPFSKIARIALIVTVPIMYQYVIVGRNYCLIILLVALICTMNKNKKQHPIIYGILLGLLANTHLIMSGFVGMIALTFYVYELLFNRKNNTKKENRGILIGLIIVVLSLALLVFQELRCIYAEAAELPRELNIAELLKKTVFYSLDFGGSLFGKWGLVFDVLIIFFIGVGIWDYRKETAIFVVSAVVQGFVYAVIGINEGYMTISILAILMYSIWSAAETLQQNKNKNNDLIIKMFEIILIVISIMSIPKIYQRYKVDYKYNYSSGKEAAEYIENNIDKGAVFVTSYEPQCSTIAGYLNKNDYKFWDVKNENYYTYVTWVSSLDKVVTGKEAEKNIEESFNKQNTKLYYIACPRKKDEIKDYLLEEKKMTEVYQTKMGLIGEEEYIIYKID